MIDQNWDQIDEFPRYFVNQEGKVLDSERDMLIHPNVVTGGALAVRLRGNDGQYYTRSLKVLVAQRFVDIDFDGEHFDLATFDTPILLDNDQRNVISTNIRWRPRWFAWEYSHQFRDIESRYYRGPLKCFQNNLRFKDVISVGTYYGLLFKKVYDAAKSFEDEIYHEYHYSWEGQGEMPPPVWPIGKNFAFIN